MPKNNRGRVRVFFAEFEGDNETIQEALQAISVAVNKTFQSPQKTIKVLSASNNLEDVNENFEEIALEDEEMIDVVSNTKPKQSSYKPPNLTIVKDLNLRPESQPSWRDFYAEKKPDTNEQAFTVAVYYLKVILKLDTVTAEHVFTCFKDVSRRTPKNMPQSIRDTAKRKGWLDTSERGNIKITNHGENMVEYDLPLSIIINN